MLFRYDCFPRNLPTRSKDCSEIDLLEDFIGGIFYVGKGQKARPFAHFYEALKATNSPAKVCNSRIARLHFGAYN